MGDESEDNGAMKPGETVPSGQQKYQIVQMLGEGGFGAVYKVHPVGSPDKLYAMKVETRTTAKDNSKLKMEIHILKLVAKERGNNSHFTAIIDRGRTDKFYFLVMQLVGKSLEDIQTELPGKVGDADVRFTALQCFTMATSLSAGKQMLEGLEDLHKYGIIHRDIKPANYAIGLGGKARLIYILDFGIARVFIKGEGNQRLKTPRCVVNFKGTVRYAALACHRNEDLSPKDDVESWLYALVEMMNPAGLPWRNCYEKLVVMLFKDDCRTDLQRREVFIPPTKCRNVVWQMVELVDSMGYETVVSYDKFYQMIEKCAEMEGVNLNDPMDWEKKK